MDIDEINVEEIPYFGQEVEADDGSAGMEAVDDSGCGPMSCATWPTLSSRRRWLEDDVRQVLESPSGVPVRPIIGRPEAPLIG